MYKIWSLALAVLLVTACNNDNSTTTETTTTETEMEMKAPADEPSAPAGRLAQNFPDLFAYLEAQDSSFAMQHFLTPSEGAIESLPPVKMEPEQLKPFEGFLIYNEDSTKAIDLFSYNYIITRRNGEVKLEEAGPDTEIAVIDVATNMRRRIFFSGPSVTVFEAKWNGDNEVIMAGAEQLQNNSIKPIIWQYNLSDSTLQMYSYDEAVTADMKGFMNKRRAPQRNL